VTDEDYRRRWHGVKNVGFHNSKGALIMHCTASRPVLSFFHFSSPAAVWSVVFQSPVVGHLRPADHVAEDSSHRAQASLLD